MRQTNYIAFSLWGNAPAFNIGAIRNVALAEKIYPNWKVMVYHDRTVPAETLTQLSEQGAALKDMTDSGIYGLFWRFLAADIDDCSHAIFRDTDSRLTFRERKAVDQWVASGNTLHVMRDHPHHHTPFGAEGLGILGGMWGITGGSYPMEAAIRRFIESEDDHYGIDQTFLQEIYQAFGHSQTTHDEFFERKPFPINRTGYQFVGERINEHEQPIGADRETLEQHLSRQKPSLFKRIRKAIFGR